MRFADFLSRLTKKSSASPVVRDFDHKLLHHVKRPAWPGLRQLKYLPRFLDVKEKRLIKFFISLALVAAISWSTLWLISNHHTTPKDGGEYSEALVGQPKLINPLFASQNETDADLSYLIYSGLFRYHSDGKLLPDLASGYTLSDDKKTYTVKLREDVKWSDGEPFTANDILFTFQSVQDPEAGSPLITAFQGVTIEQIDDYTINFILKEPFAPFLGSLTLGILPEHLWGDIPPSGLRLAKNNIQPIGTGPWVFSKMVKDDSGTIQSYSLARNEKYFGVKPYIKNLVFRFYGDYLQAGDALKSQTVSALSFVPSDLQDKVASKNISFYDLWMPQYTALFFNQNSTALLKDSGLRLALAEAIDKLALLASALNNRGEVIDGPILKGQIGYYPDLKKIDFNVEAANTLLDKNWSRIPPEEYFKIKHDLLIKEREAEIALLKKQITSSTAATVSSSLDKIENDVNETVRSGMSADQMFYRKDKTNKLLELTLTTGNTPEYAKVAENLAKMWHAIGVKVSLNTINTHQMVRDTLRNRDYQMLLYGEIVGNDPDPYAFWHSSQADYPGLNLASYVNRNADKLLEDARTATNDADREKLYRKFQDLLVSDLPAVFLYTPTYTFAVNKDIKGLVAKRIFTPSDRFDDLNNWYINTSWSWKEPSQP